MQKKINLTAKEELQNNFSVVHSENLKSLKDSFLE